MMKVIVVRARPLFCGVFAAVLLFGFLGALRAPLVRAVFASPAGRSLPIYSVQTDQPFAALGINCAWDDQDIPSMLQTLAEAQVHATFFLLGEWAERFPDSAKAIAAAGHEIGSHSYSHRDMDSLTQQEMLEEIRLSQQAIYNTCGQTPVLFRPPSGSYNDAVIESIHSSGCVPIQWNLDTLDWHGLSAEQIAHRVSSQLQPGSILLLHAGAEHSAQALPLILEAAKAADLQFVPVGSLLIPNSTHVDHNGCQLPAQPQK